MIPNEKIIITLNADNFSTLSTFYKEVENKLTKNLNWKIGRNFNALNDILRGGFGVFEYEEPIKIIWLNHIKSQKDLGAVETQKNIPPDRNPKEQTIFDMIVEIIKGHKHIELELL